MDDWKPGDLALCVRDDWGGAPPEPYPKRGEIAPVQDVGTCRCGCGTIYLCFARWHGTELGWNEKCFKKIDPLSDVEEREARSELEVDNLVEVLAATGLLLDGTVWFR